MLESSINNRTTFSEISNQKSTVIVQEARVIRKLSSKSEVQVKHYDQKISKFSQQLYAFVYGHLIDFPKCDIAYEMVTTANFLRHVNRLIKAQIHLHHSHVTGEILGYTHDFCNWRLRENKTEFSCIAYNFFGFDMYFLIADTQQ